MALTGSFATGTPVRLLDCAHVGRRRGQELFMSGSAQGRSDGFCPTCVHFGAHRVPCLDDVIQSISCPPSLEIASKTASSDRWTRLFVLFSKAQGLHMRLRAGHRPPSSARLKTTLNSQPGSFPGFAQPKHRPARRAFNISYRYQTFGRVHQDRLYLSPLSGPGTGRNVKSPPSTTHEDFAISN